VPDYLVVRYINQALNMEQAVDEHDKNLRDRIIYCLAMLPVRAHSNTTGN